MTIELILLILIFALGIALIVTMLSFKKALNDKDRELEDLEDSITDRVSLNTAEIRKDINERLLNDNEENRKNRLEVREMIEKSQEKIGETLKTSLNEMQESNKAKLNEIELGINKKLDTSLNERLDSSFKTVGEQLKSLYESLGALSKLETGVDSLNRTLSNVKKRGVFGEIQMENILRDILPATLYDKNVVTKKSEGQNRDAVEFAIKIPDKDTVGQFMYLPIDSKFPATIYDKIIEASTKADEAELKAATKELELRVKSDAKDIKDKYLDPPATTDFALMFLPTESLFAEVLRIPGILEECQTKYHVVITGPTTAAALINSLNIGFRYMAVNKDSQNILKILSAIKSQMGTLGDLINTAQNRIDLASKATTELKHRTGIIGKKLSSVEEMDPLDAEKTLELSGDYTLNNTNE